MGTSLSKHWGFHHGQSITTASCMMSGSEAWSSKLPQLIYVPGEVSQKKWPCAILWWPSLGIRYHALCGAVLLMMRYFFVLYFGLFWYFWFDHASFIHVLAFACVLQWLRVDSDLYLMIVLEKSNCCHSLIGLPHGSSTSVSRRNEFLEPSSIPARPPCWRDLDGEWWMDRGDSRVFTKTPG